MKWYTTYNWISVNREEGKIATCAFTHDHARELGLDRFTTKDEIFLSELEALRLINKWNIQHRGYYFVYFLTDSC